MKANVDQIDGSLVPSLFNLRGFQELLVIQVRILLKCVLNSGVSNLENCFVSIGAKKGRNLGSFKLIECIQMVESVFLNFSLVRNYAVETFYWCEMLLHKISSVRNSILTFKLLFNYIFLCNFPRVGMEFKLKESIQMVEIVFLNFSMVRNYTVETFYWCEMLFHKISSVRNLILTFKFPFNLIFLYNFSRIGMRVIISV